MDYANDYLYASISYDVERAFYRLFGEEWRREDRQIGRAGGE